LAYLDKIVKHLVQEKVHKQKLVQEMIEKKKADEDAKKEDELKKQHEAAE
jgi:hypothetical protein